ncbi:phosphopantetheine-binding protein [Acerihabitans sp.]|uniref:phosphopantetheine-binding protein n=1 Tax=Acerihabitans sp. TaxID=2811394 RepID=UPI002EDA25F1
MTSKTICNITDYDNSELIQRELYSMLAYRLGREEAEINGHLNLAEELYVDSLDLMEIEIGLAETFGVELKKNAMLSMQTVDDLFCLVVEALNAQQVSKI